MGFSFDMKFMDIPKKNITLEEISDFLNEEGQAKRIHFASTHVTALKRKEEGQIVGTITLPFPDTIGSILKGCINRDIVLFLSRFNNSVYRRIMTEDEFKKLEVFINEYRNIVFLRDFLDLSLALDMNYEEDCHTEIGDWEYRAKYKDDKDAEEKLGEACKEWLEKLPFFKDADYICAIPNSRKEVQLPQRIVNRMNGFGFENISDKVYWVNKKRSLKEAVDVGEKLEILEESGLTIDGNLDLNNKTVLLFDDLYQSGTTMQYVAMKLKQVGAQRVFGIAIVKSKSNK